MSMTIVWLRMSLFLVLRLGGGLGSGNDLGELVVWYGGRSVLSSVCRRNQYLGVI